MSNWISVLDAFLEKSLQPLNHAPFPQSVSMNLEHALHSALIKINPECSEDYFSGARDMACSYIEARLEDSDYSCVWFDGENHTGRFVLSLRSSMAQNDQASTS